MSVFRTGVPLCSPVEFSVVPYNLKATIFEDIWAMRTKEATAEASKEAAAVGEDEGDDEDDKVPHHRQRVQCASPPARDSHWASRPADECGEPRSASFKPGFITIVFNSGSLHDAPPLFRWRYFSGADLPRESALR